MENEKLLKQGLWDVEEETLETVPKRGSLRWRNTLTWLLHIVLLSTSGLFLLSAIRVKASLARQKLTFDILSNSALNGISDSYKTVRFEGTLNRTSPYKGPPTPDVDRLWSKIQDVPAIMIDEDIYKTLNASKHAVKIPKSMGEGRLATFEATHQLHCVFVLWQLAYPEYYTEKMAFAAAHPKDFFDHIDHCADMLRQKIMCDADAGLITYSWVKGHYSPHPNFNVQHQCRDFDAIMKFANEHTVDPTNPEVGSFRRPNDDSWVDFDWEPPSDPNAGD